MKQFLPKWRILRNICFVTCVCLALVPILMGVKAFLTVLLTPQHEHIAVYEALKTSLIYNSVGGVLLCIGILFCYASVSNKVNLCASISIAGTLSFTCYGVLILLYGFAAGKYLASLGFFALIGYINIALFIGARAYNSYLWDKQAKKENKPKEELEEYKTHFMTPAI